MVRPDQITSRSLQRSILIASCLGILIISLVIAGVCLMPYWRYLRQDGERNLQFAFHTRKMAVEAYFANVLKVASQLTRRTHVRQKLAALSQGKGMSREELVNFIRPVYLDALSDRTDLIGITLLDYQGTLLLEVGSGTPLPWRLLLAAIKSEEILGPMHQSDKTFIVVGKPIISAGIRVGLVLATFQVESLRQIVADPTGLGQTGQTLLGRRGEATAILFFPCHAGSMGGNSQSCLTKLTPFFRYACRGDLGLAVLRPGKDIVAYGPLAGTPYGMVICINQTEVYAAISSQLPFVAAVIFGFIIIGVWGMSLLLRPLTGKIILHSEDLSREIHGKTAELHQELLRHRETESKLRNSEDRLRTLAGQLICTQEQERLRIYRELHDELGQSLTACKIRLRSLEKSLPPRQHESWQACKKLEELLDGLMNDIRRLCHDLSPHILEELGLEAAIRHLLEEMHVPGTLRIEVDMDSLAGMFSPGQEINIYRIVQEALGNIGKHAGADVISLSVVRQNGRLTFDIWDNGCGFEPATVKSGPCRSDGMGLTSMMARARLLHGSLQVDSQPGAGTHLNLTIPVDQPFLSQGNTQNYEKVEKQELRTASEIPKRELGNQAFSGQEIE